MSDPGRKYATLRHPTIEAVVGGHYRYKEKAHAIARLNSIRDHFILSKEQPASTSANPVIVLWIKGYAVTEAEAQEGYTGHFAQMQLAKRKDGTFTLSATKLTKPLTNHPQKKRPAAKHPNWGHPIMRAVKRGKLYTTLEAAQEELDRLHLEFPEVTIPGNGKLYLIIYEKRPGIARPTHKIALTIEAAGGGGFCLIHRENEKKQSASPKAVTKEAVEAPAMPGHFASVEEVRKLQRRKSRPSVATTPVHAADAGAFSAAEKERKSRKKKKKLPRVSAAPPEDVDTETSARFRAAELEREARRRRRRTLFDITRQTKRDEPS